MKKTTKLFIIYSALSFLYALGGGIAAKHSDIILTVIFTIALIICVPQVWYYGSVDEDEEDE